MSVANRIAWRCRLAIGLIRWTIFSPENSRINSPASMHVRFVSPSTLDELVGEVHELGDFFRQEKNWENGREFMERHLSQQQQPRHFRQVRLGLRLLVVNLIGTFTIRSKSKHQSNTKTVFEWNGWPWNDDASTSVQSRQKHIRTN